jgi:hypothetical protein
MKTWIFVAFCTVGLISCKDTTEWSRLKSIDSSLSILDDPPRLLAIATSYEGPPGLPSESPVEPTVSTRHEALRALLVLQRKRFKVSIPPIKGGETTGIDHVYVGILRTNQNGFTLLATPGLLPETKAPEGDYWNLEELTFDKSGKLMLRQPHNQ